MSEVRVNNIVDYGGKGAPTFDNGAVISGVSSLGSQAKIGSNVTITSGGINVSGVTTAATLSGNLTGDVNSGFVTATSAVIGSGVTINAGGLNITGVVTATTFEGSGANMTGVAMTITPLAYNPDVNDSIVTVGTGIGITFDHRILAGSGNVTLSIATNAGAAGTTVENFGVGSSVTIAGRKATISPASDLTEGETYHISYPSGAFTNTGGDVSYVGTAYTFGVQLKQRQLWLWGTNEYGQLAQNDKDVHRSSPVQVPGTTWSSVGLSGGSQIANTVVATKTDGTLWSWGMNNYGALGQNQAPAVRPNISSPIQIGSATDWDRPAGGWDNGNLALKTNGTLWVWGLNDDGELGQNNNIDYSSPVQIPGTTWSAVSAGGYFAIATKTDNTLWAWGNGTFGKLGQNNTTSYSSPVQIPGTDWSTGFGKITTANHTGWAIKTNGELWSWGYNGQGEIGNNNKTTRSSPVQIPGTTWNTVDSSGGNTVATKTDGTLWTWRANGEGQFANPSIATNVLISSPIQIGSDTN